MNFQYDQLGSMRQTLFQYIKSCHSDDLEPCFNLLQSLTNNGSNLYLIEEQIGNLKISLDSTLFFCTGQWCIMTGFFPQNQPRLPKIEQFTIPRITLSQYESMKLIMKRLIAWHGHAPSTRVLINYDGPCFFCFRKRLPCFSAHDAKQNWTHAAN